MQELIQSCKNAIENGRCLGCVALENPYFTGNKDCEFGKIPTAQQSIEKIKEILGIQEKMKI